MQEEEEEEVEEQIDYSNLDITEFLYYRRIQKEMEAYKKENTASNMYKNKSNRISSSEKLARRHAVDNVQRSIIILLNSHSDTARRLGRQMKLEKEYIGVKQMETLKIRIEQVTHQPAAGYYTLAEIGDVLGVTRERVRQLEDSALKVLKHPRMLRMLREHQEDVTYLEPLF